MFFKGLQCFLKMIEPKEYCKNFKKNENFLFSFVLFCGILILLQ